jgi:hypothetical protein
MMATLHFLGRQLRRVWLIGVWSMASLATAATPMHVILTVPPGPFPGRLAEKLHAWEQAGAISGAQLMDVVAGERSSNTVAPNSALGAVAIVEFADEAAFARWKKMLSATDAPGPVVTPVDVLSRLNVTPRDSKAAVFLLAEYEIMAPPKRYHDYVKGYVMPQLEAWKKSGLITSAVMYATRNREGAPFHAMLVLEHRDAATFARRDAVKDESRNQLAADPAWKALSDVKATIRTEKFLTRATLAGGFPLGD